MPIYQLDDFIPSIDPSAYVAESADIIGQVVLSAGVSVWSHVAIRADNEPIVIGRNSSIQESTVMHVDKGSPLTVGENVTVGHQAMLHGCTIQDGALIGMQAIVLNGAVIGRNCLIGAGALVTEGKVIPDNSMVLGSPGKVVREVSEAQARVMAHGALHYVENWKRYRAILKARA
jgi:carbonic anhydrase/acetyltransferase-like protein (isoleucine patch superfamily)